MLSFSKSSKEYNTVNFFKDTFFLMGLTKYTEMVPVRVGLKIKNYNRLAIFRELINIFVPLRIYNALLGPV